MKLYLVDAISSFRNSYVVRCKDESHAADSVTMEEPESEMSQHWLGEHISRIQEITEEEYLTMFNKDNDYIKGWTDEQKKKFIHTVNYDEEPKPFNPIEDGKAEI
jgi:hypothetical protein